LPNTFTHFPYSGDGVTSIAAYFQALNAAHAGYGVLTGMEVSRTSASALAIAAGTYANGIPPSTETYAGGTITGISAAASGKHRYDLVYLDTSDGTAKLAAGVPDTPSNAANFLENAVPQPGDLPDENAILLAVICVDDSGIVAGDHGSYSTAGVADMRLKLAVGTHLVSYLYDSGEARGDLITRKAAGWDRLATGTTGQYLQSQGAGADLIWGGLQIPSLTVASEARGDLVARGATAFGRLAPGSANRYLMSNGAAADLTYELLKIESLYHASEAQGCFPTKGATTWSVLAPGPAGYVLKSGGAGADLSWVSIAAALEGIGTCARGDILYRGASNWDRLPKGTATYFLKQGTDDPAWTQITSTRYWDAPAGSWQLPASNPPEPDWDAGANGSTRVYKFDDTTEEFAEASMRVPDDINSSGTVTFELTGYSLTAASGKYVQWKLYHSAKASGESWDAAYSYKVSGDKACDAVQDQLDVHSWTETVTNLGWAAGDHVRLKLSRIAPSGTNLTGDYCMVHFRMKIPTVIS